MNLSAWEYLILSFFLSTASATAQVPRDTGELRLEISTIIANMPSHTGNDYIAPSSTQLQSWGQLLHHLLEGNYQQAADTATLLNYQLTEYLDTAAAPFSSYYFLQATGSNYWGTYIYNPNYCRPVIIQSPHPKKDFNTGKEGIHVFMASEAFFFCLSGTSRCNQSAFSTCSGSTSVCSGSSENYRISDLAHNEATIFQMTTDTLFQKYGNTYFLQLHGFTKKATDPYVILSNGTQVTPALDYIVPFSTHLFNEDNVLTFKIAHVDLSWTRLRGFTNTQGRLINASTNACSANATISDGRFIHLEQEKIRLRNDETGWNKVANALLNTIPCASLPVELLFFEVRQKASGEVFVQWESALEKDLEYFILERSGNGFDWQVLGKILPGKNTSEPGHYTFSDQNPLAGKSYYRLKLVDSSLSFSYSPVRVLVSQKPGESLRIYPNPAYGLVTLTGNREELEDLKIYNAYGQEQSTKVAIIQKETAVQLWDISRLAKGFYFIKSPFLVYKIYHY